MKKKYKNYLVGTYLMRIRVVNNIYTYICIDIPNVPMCILYLYKYLTSIFENNYLFIITEGIYQIIERSWEENFST